LGVLSQIPIAVELRPLCVRFLLRFRASPDLYSIIGAFTALAIWSSIPLTIRLLFTFQRYRGLYFWTILVTTWSLNLRAIGFLLRYAVPSCPLVLTGVLAEVGWVGMVSGFSMVLYSRLNLLIQRRDVLRLVLAMIIVDGVCLHTSTIVVQFVYAAQPPNDPKRRAPWIAASNKIERVQAVWFTVQQLVITSLYIKAAWDYLEDRELSNQRIKKVMMSLIVVQLSVLIIDIVVVVLESAGYFVAKMIIHSFIYSIKLEIEFAVLNQLVALSRLSSDGIRNPPDLEPGLLNPSPAAPASVTTAGFHHRKKDTLPQIRTGLAPDALV
jgi:hypothetical protein